MRNYFINSKTFNFSFTDTLIRLHLYTSKFVFPCLDMCGLLYSSISPDQVIIPFLYCNRYTYIPLYLYISLPHLSYPSLASLTNVYINVTYIAGPSQCIEKNMHSAVTPVSSPPALLPRMESAVRNNLKVRKALISATYLIGVCCQVPYVCVRLN